MNILILNQKSCLLVIAFRAISLAFKPKWLQIFFMDGVLRRFFKAEMDNVIHKIVFKEQSWKHWKRSWIVGICARWFVDVCLRVCVTFCFWSITINWTSVQTCLTYNYGLFFVVFFQKCLSFYICKCSILNETSLLKGRFIATGLWFM